jgi:hypothetical protein
MFQNKERRKPQEEMIEAFGKRSACDAAVK